MYQGTTGGAGPGGRGHAVRIDRLRYIDNTVQMNTLAALNDNPNALDKVYNVAFNDRTSLNQLLEVIRERLAERVVDLPEVNITYRDFRAGDVGHSQTDISKARKLLGYEPTHKISDGLDDAMDWYVASLGK